jgi:type IV pilus assembly protein PilE
MENQHWMERNFSVSGRYNQKSDGTAIVSADLPVLTAPRDGATAFYTLSFSAGPNTSTYTIQAVPGNGQQADAKCGTLTLTQAGAKGESGTGTVADCW